jgi:hypothetical protein
MPLHLVAYRILVGKPEGKRQLGSLRRRRMDNIKIDLRLNVVVWTVLIWLRIGTTGGLFVNTVMNLWGWITFWESLE